MKHQQKETPYNPQAVNKQLQIRNISQQTFESDELERDPLSNQKDIFEHFFSPQNQQIQSSQQTTSSDFYSEYIVHESKQIVQKKQILTKKTNLVTENKQQKQQISPSKFENKKNDQQSKEQKFKFQNSNEKNQNNEQQKLSSKKVSAQKEPLKQSKGKQANKIQKEQTNMDAGFEYQFNPDQINTEQEADQKLKMSLASSQPPEPIEQSSVPKPQTYSDVDWILNNDYTDQNYKSDNRVFDYNQIQLNQSYKQKEGRVQEQVKKQSQIKNKWLKDLASQLATDKDAQQSNNSPNQNFGCSQQSLFSSQSNKKKKINDQKRHSDANNQKFRKIEQEIQDTKLNIFLKSKEENGNERSSSLIESLDNVNVLQPSSVTPLRSNDSPSYFKQSNRKVSQYDNKNQFINLNLMNNQQQEQKQSQLPQSSQFNLNNDQTSKSQNSSAQKHKQDLKSNNQSLLNSQSNSKKQQNPNDHGISRNSQQELKDLNQLIILKPQKCEKSETSPQIISKYENNSNENIKLQKEEEEKILDELMEKAMEKLNQEFKYNQNKVQDFAYDQKLEKNDQINISQQESQESENGYMMIEKLFKKHTEGIGIDTILESDANFEQTQQLRQSIGEKFINSNFDRNSYKKQLNQFSDRYQSQPDQHCLNSLDYYDYQNQSNSFFTKNGPKINQKFENENKISVSNQSKNTDLAETKNFPQKFEQQLEKNWQHPINQNIQITQNLSILDSQQISQKRQIKNVSQTKSLRSQRSVFSNQNKNQFQNHQQYKIFKNTIKDQSQINKKAEPKIQTNQTIDKKIQKSQLMIQFDYKTDDIRYFDSKLNSNQQENQISKTEQTLNFDYLYSLNQRQNLQDNNSQNSQQQDKKLRMQDVQKLYQNRVDFFKDFYKNVKSYKNFSHDDQYKEFLERKEEEERKRKLQKQKLQISDRCSNLDVKSARQSTSLTSQRIYSSNQIQSTHQLQTQRNFANSNLITSRLSRVSSQKSISKVRLKSNDQSNINILKKNQFGSQTQLNKQDIHKQQNLSKMQHQRALSFDLQYNNKYNNKLNKNVHEVKPKIKSYQQIEPNYKQKKKQEFHSNQQQNLNKNIIQKLKNNKIEKPLIKKEIEQELEQALRHLKSNDAPILQLQNIVQDLKMTSENSIDFIQQFLENIMINSQIDKDKLRSDLIKILSETFSYISSNQSNYEAHFVKNRQEHQQKKEQNKKLIQQIYDKAQNLRMYQQTSRKYNFDKKFASNYNPVLNKQKSNQNLYSFKTNYKYNILNKQVINKIADSQIKTVQKSIQNNKNLIKQQLENLNDKNSFLNYKLKQEANKVKQSNQQQQINSQQNNNIISQIEQNEINQIEIKEQLEGQQTCEQKSEQKEFEKIISNRYKQLSSERRSKRSPKEFSRSSRQSFKIDRSNYKTNSPIQQNNSPCSQKNFLNPNNSIEKLEHSQVQLPQSNNSNLIQFYRDNEKQFQDCDITHSQQNQENYAYQSQSNTIQQKNVVSLVEYQGSSCESHQQSKNEDTFEEEQPILILDIKILKDNPKKIVIYENDNSEEIVDKFCFENSKYHHNILIQINIDINDQKKRKLLSVINQQIQEYYNEQKIQLEQYENMKSQSSQAQNVLQDIQSQLSSNCSPNTIQRTSQITDEQINYDYQNQNGDINNFNKAALRNSLTQIDEHENEEHTIDF